MSGPDKNTSIIASRVSIFTTTFNTTNITTLPRVWIFGGTHPRAPTSLAHSPSAPSVRPSVRLNNNFMFLSVVDTRHLEVEKILFFFLSFFLSCTAARPGTPHSGPGTPPTNVTKSLCNERGEKLSGR